MALVFASILKYRPRRKAALGAQHLALLLTIGGIVFTSCHDYESLCESNCDDGGGEAGEASDSAAGGGTRSMPSPDRGGQGGASAAGAGASEAASAIGGAGAAGEEGAAGAGGGCATGSACEESQCPGPITGCRSSSAWLLLASHERLVGLPIDQLGTRELVVLGEKESTDVFVGFEQAIFSPIGHHALVQYLSHDFGYEIYELYFDRGAPGQIRPIKNLPAWGEFKQPFYSPDGSFAVLPEFDGPGYLLDFTGDKTVASVLPAAPLTAYGLGICADGSIFASENQQLVTRVRDEAADIVASPDARKVLVGENELRHCSAKATGVTLDVAMDEAEWNPDSRHVLLSRDDTSRVLKVADDLKVTEVWTGANASTGDWLNGSALLLPADFAGPGLSYLDISVTPGVVRPLGLDSDATVVGCSEEACLAIAPVDATKTDVVIVPLATGKPSPLLHDVADLEVPWVDWEHQRAVLSRPNVNGRSLSVLDFARSPAREEALFAWDTAGDPSYTFAPDGGGFVLQLHFDIDYVNYWVRLPSGEQPIAVVPLNEPAYFNVIQPRP
jgi:hypothetical protein